MKTIYIFGWLMWGFYDLWQWTTCKCLCPVNLWGNSGRKMEINPGSVHPRRGPSGFESEGRDCSETGYSLCWALRLNRLWWTSWGGSDRKPWWHDRDLLFTSDADSCSKDHIIDILLHKITNTYDNIHSPTTLLGTPVQLLGNTNC